MEKQRKRHEHLVSAVEEGSIGWELGIEPGDRLLSINGQEIEDVFVAGNVFWQLKGKLLSYRDLERLPILCLEGNTSTRSYVEAFLEEQGVVLRPEFELATSNMLIQFALRGLGIASVVREFAKEYLASGELFELTFDRRLPKRNFCIVTDDRLPQTAAARKLLTMLKGERELS